MNTIAKAKADDIITSHVAGLASETIPDGTFGYITIHGELESMPTSTFVAGDELFLSDITAGGATTIKPMSPNFVVSMGHVGVSDAVDGTFIANIKTPSTTRDIAWFPIPTATFSTANAQTANVTETLKALTGTLGTANAEIVNITTYARIHDATFGLSSSKHFYCHR